MQDRSGKPRSTAAFDDRLTAALRTVGLVAVTVAFEPPAEVDLAVQQAGCDYTLYTDLIQAGETPGSRLVRGLRRLRRQPAAGPTAVQAEVEFRLYEADAAGPPILSTSVTGKARARDLPFACERINLVPQPCVDTSITYGSLAVPTDAERDSLTGLSLDAAFSREARVVHAVLRRIVE